MILASCSPQRRAILDQLGVGFGVVEVDVEELAEGDPSAVAVENARRKACRGHALSAAPVDAPVLGVDTLVSLDGRIFGKPTDQSQARAMLGALSGQRHVVVGGMALIRPGGELQTAAHHTSVTFRRLSGAAIDAYLATGEWRGRAGAYAIQGRGAALVSRIEGDYLNVVGLPGAGLVDLLPELLGGS